MATILSDNNRRSHKRQTRHPDQRAPSSMLWSSHVRALLVWSAAAATIGTTVSGALLVVAPPPSSTFVFSRAPRIHHPLLSNNNNNNNRNALCAAARNNPGTESSGSGGGEDDDDDVCGEGFYKQTGPDGDCCVFDYDAAARAFGTAVEQPQPIEEEDHYWEALEGQNRARNKFGMEPLTPEQYVALRGQVHQMEARQAADAAARAFAEFDANHDGAVTAEELRMGLEKMLRAQVSDEQAQQVLDHFDTSGDGLLQPDEFVPADRLRSKIDAVVRETEMASQVAEGEQRSPGILQHFMNTMFQDTCESNYDCERPEVCCDFSFKKMCCSSGQMAQELMLEYATVPMPQHGSP